MHLPLIAATSKVVDDLAEPAGAMRKPATGEGFQAVFSAEVETEGDGGGGGGAEREAAATGSDRLVPDPPVSGAAVSGTPLPDARVPAGATGISILHGGEIALAEEDGAGALLAHAVALPSVGDAVSDDMSASETSPALRDGEVRETVPADAWVLPALVAPTSASSEANTGSRPEGVSRARAPASAMAEPAGGEIAAAAGVAVAKIAGADGSAPAGGALKPLSEGADKLAQAGSQPPAGTSGSATNAGTATPGSTPATAELNAGAPGQAAGTARATGAIPLDGTLRPVDLSDGAGAEPPSAPSAGRQAPVEGGTPKQVGVDQPGSPAGGIPLPSGFQARLAPGRDAAVEPGPATVLPEAAASPKSEAPVMAAATATTQAMPPAGSTVTGERAGAADADDGLFDADRIVVDPALGEPRGTTRGPLTSATPVLHTPEASRQVALQIAEVVRASGDRTVELKLQPEELGRVHLTMSQDATGTLTVSLNVERADTLDLLRRNIELLRADLQELGYGSVDFSFQGDGAGSEQNPQAGTGDAPGAVETAAERATATPAPTVARGSQPPADGIDIRL